MIKDSCTLWLGDVTWPNARHQVGESALLHFLLWCAGLVASGSTCSSSDRKGPS